MRLHDVDLAAVDPCPSCGTPTRRMGSVPIAGSGLDLVFSGPWTCRACLQAKCDAAVADITSPLPDLDRFDEASPPIKTGVLQ